MDDLPNDESSDAMAQMMGFSTFSGGSRKKPKHDHGQTVTTQPLPQKPPSTSANSLPLGARPIISQASHQNHQARALHSKNPTHNNENNSTTTTIVNSSMTTPTRAEKAWTNPYTGHEYTAALMTSWANGVVREDGVRVYFKPGFIEADPWAELTGKIERV